MIVHDVEQRSTEWFRLHAGVVTASAMGKVVTKAKLQASTGMAYFARLVAERLLGVPLDTFDGTDFTSRGIEMEPEARAWYAAVTDADVEEVGFLTTDDGEVGCSPDGLVGADGMLELKVPGPQNAVIYALCPERLVADYRLQVQTALWISEREWIDLCSYNPRIKPVCVRVTPETEVFRALDEHVPAFVERVKEAVIRLQVEAMGGDPMSEQDRADAAVFA